MTEPDEVRGGHALTPAVVAAAAFAVLATLISITFVAARGGLVLPVAGSPPPVAVATPVSSGSGPTPGPSQVAVVPTPSILPESSPTLEPSTAPTTVPSAPPPTPHPTPFDPLFALAGCPGQPGCYEYTVRRGDTLSTISDHYRVALWITMALNPEAVSSGSIVVGETVYLGHDPEARLKPCPQAESCRLYTVRQGDTISRIARRYGLTSSAILARNPGLQPTLIVPGQVIKLPLYVAPG